MSSHPLGSRLVACVATVALAAVGHAQAQVAKPDPKLEGRYQAEGMNPDGQPYRSTVDIEPAGDTYLLRWIERDGRRAAVGIGIVRGEYLSVSYLAGRSLGVVVYHIGPGPQLKGQWTVLGADGGLWPETLSRAGVAAERLDAPSPPENGSAPPAPPARADALASARD